MDEAGYNDRLIKRLARSQVILKGDGEKEVGKEC